MRRTLSLLILCLVTFPLSAQTTQSTTKRTKAAVVGKSSEPEFLGVKLGRPLSGQFPECRNYVYGTKEYEQWKAGGGDPPGFLCYEGDETFGRLFSYNDTLFPGGSEDVTEHVEARDKAALATILPDDAGKVGQVDTTYSMDVFSETLAEIKAKRGSPTLCTQRVVQNLMGVRLGQRHCEWKQPWGRIVIVGPSSDDLTVFDLWAETTAHMEKMKRERSETRKKNSKDF